MTKNQKIQGIVKTFDTLNDVRQLSFRVHERSEQLRSQKTRIEKLVREVQETMDLKTAYDTRSNELTHKLEEIKKLAMQTKIPLE